MHDQDMPDAVHERPSSNLCSKPLHKTPGPNLNQEVMSNYTRVVHWPQYDSMQELG